MAFSSSCRSSHTVALSASGNQFFEREPDIPQDWELCVHPQGWIYFVNSQLKIVTDQDIRELDIFASITDNAFHYPMSDLDDGMEVQINTRAGPSGTAIFNLAINHTHCVASYKVNEVNNINIPALNPNALNRRRRLYWNYLWNHPVHVPTPERALRDAADALTWYYIDNLISGIRSVVPFSRTECEDLSRVVREMTLPCNDASVSKTVFLAWLLREVCSFRDAEYYGQYTLKEFQALRKARDRPSLTTSQQLPPYILSAVNVVINFLFFGIPWTYLAHVKSSSEYRGRLASVQRNWEEYIERLVREYSHFLLIATVLLSATVGVLAVPDIGAGTKVASTISAFASLGSIIVGVFSIWRHQTNTQTANSFTYMHNAQHNYLGYHGHAMLLSLPPVLIVWAIVTFTISIIAYALQGITALDVVDRASAWVVLCVFAIIFILVTAALYTFSIIWKFQGRASWIWSDLRSWWTREDTRVKA